MVEKEKATAESNARELDPVARSAKQLRDVRAAREMKAAGATLQEIAKKLGYANKSSVARMLGPSSPTGETAKPPEATGHRAIGDRPAPAPKGEPPIPGQRKRQSGARSRQVVADAKRKVDAREAIKLRARGHSPLEIAEQLGLAVVTVRKMIDQEFAATPVPEIRKVRFEECATLDELKVAASAMFHNEESPVRDRLQAGALILKIGERRAKLLGLDAPVKSEVTGKAGGPLQFQDVTGLQDDIDKRLDQLGADLFGTKPDAAATAAVESGDAGTPAEGGA